MWCFASLPTKKFQINIEYKLPKQIFRFDKFPMTSNGKIDVAALKKMIENMP